MSNISAKIEALLFASAKPLTKKGIARILEISLEEIENGVADLNELCLSDGRGLVLQEHGDQIQLVTKPEFAEIVSTVAKEDIAGELTRASLETLTVLAYRGPMTRPEIEQIRGIQSSQILRNLMIRGLVEEKGMGDVGHMLFGLTLDCLKALGISRVEDLPQYEELRGHQAIQDVLSDLEEDVVVEDKEETHA